MSVMTAADLSELELLHFYLGRRIAGGGRALSVEQALQDFRDYRTQLDDAREMLREAEDSSARGLAQTVDRESLKQEIRKVVAEKGVAT